MEDSSFEEVIRVSESQCLQLEVLVGDLIMQVMTVRV